VEFFDKDIHNFLDWCCQLYSSCNCAMQHYVIVLSYFRSQCRQFRAAGWTCRLFLSLYLELKFTSIQLPPYATLSSCFHSLYLSHYMFRPNHRPSSGVIQSQSQSQSYFTTDGQSVSMSWCRAQFGTFDQRFFFFLKVTVLPYLGRPLWREVGSVICQSTVSLQ
jgi:hypothetical protein